MGCALMCFDFNYGDLIRWLEGPYTNAHRDWDETFSLLETVRDAPITHRDCPVPDIDRTHRACTEGVPLQAAYVSDYNSCAERNAAPLSDDLIKNSADVDETLRKEEKLSYHILFPRYLWRFLSGIFICIFRVAYRFGDPKPRLCVDPSTTISATDQGNINAQIPAPGVDEDQNPTIYYGTAFMRYLVWLWNLRISFPGEDIIQMTDDISAAFHRVLYHPDLAIAFATVWKNWLIIPIGTIFGSRSSPGTYMWPGESRAHLAQHMPLRDDIPPPDLVHRLRLCPELTPDQTLSLAPATRDALNPGITIHPDGTPERRQPTFVDDSGVAHVRRFFLNSATASVSAAYVIFGNPDDDPLRPPCINPRKWQEYVSWELQFLGYHIDTRKMRVIWPLEKRKKFIFFLDAMLAPQLANQGSTPQSLSRVLGIVRHAALVAPMGNFRSLHLQFLFNDRLATAPGVGQLRRWYQRKIIRLPRPVIAELQDFRNAITMDLEDPYWSRPIGLIVPRSPTITVYTDASTKALGGWSAHSELNHMWRITIEDFERCGLPRNVGWNNIGNYKEDAIDSKRVHINLLEFFAIFIELWICIRQLYLAFTTGIALFGESIPAGGHRLLALADNTSALSWLRYATRTRRPPVRRLARFLTAFLCHPFAAEYLRVQGRHLPGLENEGADHLSRFEKSPTWESAMANCAHLTNLRTCQIPCELLAILASVYLKEQTEDWYATATTKLWTIAPPTFASGSNRLAGTSTSTNFGR